MQNFISDDQWQQYQEEGYLKLGKVLSPIELAALQHRINDIMMGVADVDYDRMLMQLDSSSGQHHDLSEQSKGFKGATLNYRKIQDLEYDPLFLKFMRHPIFREACARIYTEAPYVTGYRAMFMNKPARAGTLLPWHQDAWSHLDRDPLLTVWTALDPATVENGCVQIIPGSHKLGLIDPSLSSGFITPEQAKQYAPDDRVLYLELEAGETILLHNFLLHRSDRNSSDIPRRAFSVCYMDGRTRADTNEEFPIIFDQDALQSINFRSATVAALQ